MRLATFLLTVLLAPALAGAQSRPAPDALAASVQKRYQTIRDFSADFTHVYRGGVLRMESREQGTLSVKKPGRMRWVYTSPERKEFVADGEKVYSYLPEDRQVLIVAQEHTNTPALFLAGQGDIVRDFTADYSESPVPGTLGLKLTPRQPEAEYEHLVVAVDPGTLQILALTTIDGQGGESTFLFSNIRENRGIPDREFAFRIPRGVDVVDDTAPAAGGR